ncbi:WcbI family polysaccharide biosynthesis putative acetyltransferase [Sphingomonas crusticola]|uniref:WcbI family polysaccharide biosynthesis putative acetyltransferase n=1 Tax=Sphingomonas crusticola TaxID=1697973 RepID=UPI000E250119|nr:WcbI family polysaccharide biosynthesis putative acetyltransferase [Sphingomonas crusticola]
MRERWVVIANCQSFGLASSIQSLAKDVDCTACDHWEFARRIAEDPDHFSGYDFAVVMPEIRDWAAGKPFTLPAYAHVPSFQFHAYHPDCVYVFADGEAVNGFAGPYHSMIALAAYKEGLSAEQAASLFNPEIFTAAGYFDFWIPERDTMIERFRAHGLEIGATFVRRSRGRSFMHTINHPKIEILFDFAHAVLAKIGRPIHADAMPPPDALAGTTWPIYPAIGAHLGVRGAYLFHAPNDPTPLDLMGFLERSLADYAAWDRSRLRVKWYIQPRLLRLREAIRAAL